MSNNNIEKLSVTELSRQMERQETNHRLQKDLLTFTFSASLILISAGLAIKIEKLSTAFIFLAPFLIIIPFQARITYYTLDSAHFSSFIAVFQPEEDRYREACRNNVEESYGLEKWEYRVVSWLVNHELVCLSAVCVFLFGLRIYQLNIIAPRPIWKNFIAGLTALISICTVIWLSEMAFPYKKVYDKFLELWKEEKRRLSDEGITQDDDSARDEPNADS